MKESKQQISKLISDLQEKTTEYKIGEKKQKLLIRQLQNQIRNAQKMSPRKMPEEEEVKISSPKTTDEKPTTYDDDIVILGKKLGKLQAQNNILEDKISLLEQELEEEKESSNNKSRLINSNIHLFSVGPSRASNDRMQHRLEIQDKNRSSGFMGFFNKEDDKAAKVSALLEETLLQNLQLRDDISAMGEEVSTLLEKNNSLVEQLKVYES